MSYTINQTMLLGVVIDEPKLKNNSLSFTVETEFSSLSDSGNWEKSTDTNLVVVQNPAIIKSMDNYLVKGSKIIVNGGRLTSVIRTNKDGENIKTTFVCLTKGYGSLLLQGHDSKRFPEHNPFRNKFSSNSSSNAYREQSQPSYSASDGKFKPKLEPSIMDLDDEIPF